MPIAAALLVAAVTLLILAPLALTAGHWQVHHPRTALALWFAAVGAGAALTVSSIAAIILEALAAAPSSDTGQAITVTLLAWMQLGAVGAVIGFVWVSAEPLADSQRGAIDELRSIAVSREQHRGYTLVWVDSAAPSAVAVPARKPQILVSTRLRELLSPAELRAVIAHEATHLRLRHGWAVRIAELSALCLPRALRAGRHLRRATLLLIELIADDAAAKRAGAVHLANALAKIGRAGNQPGLELRAERLTLRRWRHARRWRDPVHIGALHL
ncbi:M56 family metallopeptidase [Microbacterium sp. RD1]|uniref:M56 family metallopeptidase n=1 Tax=Microbacterium sp. RD1 TaxID=3457313 RepID=UPI003FA54F11